jgi:type IV pilus assembly protein PilO
MKLGFSKKGQLILLVGILLIMLLVVFTQFYLIAPLKSDLKVKEQTLVSEQKLLDVLTQKNTDDTNQVTEDTKELQKKVPVTPLQEQFILDLEKAENVSNSKIKSMSFSKDAVAAAAETTTEGATSEQATATTEEGSGTEQQLTATSLNGLKKLTVNLSVESTTYEDLEKFISTLESLQRIVVIESINYSGGEEVTTLNQEKVPLSYSLTVSAYYLPDLNDLIAELPKIDVPDPAKKKNPLNQFADLENDN